MSTETKTVAKNEILIEDIDIAVKKKKNYKIQSIKKEKLKLKNPAKSVKKKTVTKKQKISDKPKKRKKIHGIIRRFLSFERLKFKNIYKRKFITLARLLKRIYNKKLEELQAKINFVNQCKEFFESATEATLNHKKEFMSRLEQYEIDSLKLVEFFRMFERNKSEIENIASRISRVEFKTMLNWNRKFKNKFDKLIK